jgi:ABC-2 type transport system ATP-binding protein
MRSALGILVGLASRAPLTIFDEPYLGLDANARQQFYDVLIKDYAEQPRTIILSTHLIDEVSGLLEDVVVLDQGRVVLDGSADDLRRRACVLSGPVDAVEALVAELPVLHRERFGGHEAVTVEVQPDAALRARIAGLGVELGPVSLQTLVVHAGQNTDQGGAR